MLKTANITVNKTKKSMSIDLAVASLFFIMFLSLVCPSSVSSISIPGNLSTAIM